MLKDKKGNQRICKDCKVNLTTENAAKKNAKYYRNVCRSCRSKNNMAYNIGNPKRMAYMRQYIRRKGIVKEYPCEYCKTLCYKKYARAFCKDECRFLAYVDKTEGCWIWKGATQNKGYGKLSFRGKKTAVASRVSYELFKGPLEGKLLVCHTCDNPSCVNPEHLFLGSNMENMLDMVEKGRQYSKLTPEQVLKIRKMWNNGSTQAKIMEEFKIGCGHLSNIIHRRIWKHV